MEKKRLLILLLAISLCIPVLGFAETIVLKSSKTVEGKITEKTDKYIKMNFQGAQITYFLKDIERIDGATTKEGHFSANEEKKKVNLVIVGDATNTYASYFFILPPNWIPLMTNMRLTEQSGYWQGRHKNSPTLMEIQPQKKPNETTLANLVNMVKEYYEKDVPSGSWQKYSNFKPSINYAYEVCSLNNAKNGTYELFVFIEIPPKYFIYFILTGDGKDIECITPYFDDFNNVISSFRWILGLSDDEIGNLLKKN